MVKDVLMLLDMFSFQGRGGNFVNIKKRPIKNSEVAVPFAFTNALILANFYCNRRGIGEVISVPSFASQKRKKQCLRPKFCKEL
jgi:hypothetical protein